MIKKKLKLDLPDEIVSKIESYYSNFSFHSNKQKLKNIYNPITDYVIAQVMNNNYWVFMKLHKPFNVKLINSYFIFTAQMSHILKFYYSVQTLLVEANFETTEIMHSRTIENFRSVMSQIFQNNLIIHHIPPRISP